MLPFRGDGVAGQPGFGAGQQPLTGGATSWWQDPKRRPLVWTIGAGAALVVIVAIILGFTLIGRGSPGGAGGPVASPSPAGNPSGPENHSACPVDGADTYFTAPKRDNTEPTFVMPLMPGWNQPDWLKSSDLPGNAVTDILRATIFNTAMLATDASIVVSVKPTHDPGNVVADWMFNPAARTNPISGYPYGTITHRSSETRCGSTVYWADYTGLDFAGSSPRPGTAMVTVADGSDGRRWVGMVQIAAAHPENTAIIAQRDALLKGFYASSP